jgi:alpha-2-macroglobulin
MRYDDPVYGRILLALLAALLLPLGVLAEDPQPVTKPAPTGTDLDGLVITTEQVPGVVDSTDPGAAKVEGLSERKAGKLLAKLPPLPTRERPLPPLRPATAPPPQTGDTIDLPFPDPSELAPAATAAQGPLEVVRWSPEGDVDLQPQVRLTFSQPMVDVAGVQVPEGDVIPARLEPRQPGRWRWVGTRTLIFEPEAPLPRATDFALSVPAGTASATGGELVVEHRQTFRTEGPKFVGVSPDGGTPARRDGAVRLRFDLPVDPAQILPLVQVTANGAGHPFGPVEVTGPNEVAFTPVRPFPLAAQVEVTVAAGALSTQGTVPFGKDRSHTFAVHDALGVTRHRCGDWNCRAGTDLVVEFNNQLDVEAFDAKAIRVDPPLRGQEIEASWGSIWIRGDSAPGTYKVTLPGSLKDVYGQKLGRNKVLTFEVVVEGPLRAQLQVPRGDMVVLDPDSAPVLPILSVRHPSYVVRINRVRPEDHPAWMDFRYRLERWHRSGDGGRRPDAPGDEIADVLVRPDALEQPFLLELDLASYLEPSGGTGHLGLTIETLGDEVQSHATWVQRTDLAITGWNEKGDVVAWVTSLRDGRRQADVPVRVLGWSPTKNLAEATTDTDGRAALSVLGKDERQRSVLLVAGDGDDTALLPWTARRRSAPDDSLRWFAFDDRGLYRPGETVTIKGWVRLAREDAGGVVELAVPEDRTVRWTAWDPRNNELAKGEMELTAAGGFNLAVELPPEVDLGWARIRFELPGEGRVSRRSFDHSYRVEEFRRPTFEATSSVAGGPHRVGGSADFEVRGAYFTGDPMPGSDVSWQLTATDGSYTPPGQAEFSFGPRVPWWKHHHYWDWDGPPSMSRVVSGTTDRDGRNVLRVGFRSVDADEPRPMVLTATGTVHDLDRQTRSSRSRVLVHPGEVYVGLRSTARFVLPGEPLPLEAIATGVDGDPVTGALIEVSVEPIRIEVDTADADPVQGCSLKSGDQPVACQVTLPRGGLWRIRAQTADSHGLPTVADLLVWASGGSLPAAAVAAMQQLRVEPDKDSYEPGETAELLITSPFWPAEGVWTVVEAEGETSGRFSLSGPTGVVQVPIEADDVPNKQVELLVVGSRADEAGVLRPAWSRSSQTLAVSRTIKTLTLQVDPKTDVLEPGERTSVSVRVFDPTGGAVAGAEVAVWAVDEAVLSLAGYALKSPVEALWTWRGSLYVPRGELREQLLPPTDELVEQWRRMAEESAKRSAEGAMMMDAMESEEAPEAEPVETGDSQGKKALRSDFRALAVFEAEAVTDASGGATVRFELPDNLTRYRVMAVAVVDDRSGTGESSFIARRELMVRPSAPRFLSLGDTFELPVVVQNRGERDLQVELAARGHRIELTDGSGRRVKLPAGSRTEVRLPARATSTGTAVFQVAARSRDLMDAAQVELPVWLPVTTEAFATYGELDSGVMVQPVAAPAGALDSWGGLEITTSSTALSALTDAVIYLVDYPFDCTEQVASRLLAIAALRDVLDAFDAPGLPDADDLAAKIASDVAVLGSRQEWSGGFRLWSSSARVDPWASVHATHALARTRLAGFDVPDDVVNKALGYLRGIEQHQGDEYTIGRAQHTLLAYALYVRALLDDGPQDRAEELLAEPGMAELPLEATALLASTLLEGGRTEAAAPVLRHIANRAVESAGTAEFADDYGEHGWRVYWSGRRTDALALEALLRGDPDTDLVPKVVRALQAHRVRGRWRSTQENSFVLLALERYFRTFEATDPDFVARLWLGDGYAGEQSFVGRSADRNTITVPMAEFGEGAEDLVIAHEGSGRLYYRVGMRYAPESLSLEAADFGFAVTRRYEGVDDPSDVTRGEDGTWTIRAGSRVRVVLELESGERRYHVALVDKLPAGLEPLPVGLAGVAATPSTSDWWGPWWIQHRNLRDERGEAFTSLLQPGVYRFDYVVRATTPGTFAAPPPRAEEMYFPETFGRGASETVVVR